MRYIVFTFLHCSVVKYKYCDRVKSPSQFIARTFLIQKEKNERKLEFFHKIDEQQNIF